jgi:hypothetical protein
MDRQIKYKLLNEVFNVLDNNRVGTPQFRHVRKNVLTSIVKDLIDLKLSITSLKSFSDYHFTALLTYWHSKGNSNSTIANKKAILKWFLNHIDINIEFPSNASLNLVRDRTKPTAYISDDLIHNIYHPINRTVLDFQLFFGLSKTESIRINLTEALSKSELQINRKLAFNSNERFISIIGDKQKQTIQYRLQVLGDHPTLLSILKERQIIDFYNTELQYNNIPDKTDLRKYFIQKRLAIYQNQGFSKKICYEALMRDTGYKCKTALMRVAFA